MVKPWELPWHEIIGLRCKVIWSRNKDYFGIEGVVVDETKNLIVLRTNKGIKKILKDRCVFEFETKDYKIYIPGKILMGRPEERLKKRIKVKRRYFEILLNALEGTNLFNKYIIQQNL